MLNIQKKYIDYISQFKDKTKEVASIKQEKFDELMQAIISKELIVPVVGGFSAGKSSLLSAIF